MAQDLPAGVIICGGRSSRMGRSKALLRFGEQSLLERIVERVRPAVGRLCIVAAPDQALPPLPKGIDLLHDHTAFAGPLVALARALAELNDGADRCFLCGCDLPLIAPELIHALDARRTGHDAVVPRDGERWQPLCAIYRTSIRGVVEQLLEGNVRSMHGLLERIDVREVPLSEVDPSGTALINVNRRADYQAALRACGF